MKHAVDGAGTRIRAEAGAPDRALCPVCGAPMVLRRRHGSRDGDMVYFWRHMDNANLDCPTRLSAASRVGANRRP